MSKSRKLFTDSKKVIPSGVNSPVRYFDPYPFFTKKANGAYIWDEDNTRYIDFCNAYGALLLGHRRKEILDSVTKQLSKGTLYCTPTAVSYTHLRAHETVLDLVCRLLLEKKK